MSLNKYNSTSGELEPISQNRMWIGTEAEYSAAVSAGTIGTDMLIYITDDEEGPTDVVEKNNKYAVQSGAVYDALQNGSPGFIGTTVLQQVKTNQSTTYTATQNCWVTGYVVYTAALGGHNPGISLNSSDGPLVVTIWSNASSSATGGNTIYGSVCFPVRKGQTVYFRQTNTSYTGRNVFECTIYNAIY